MAPSELRDLAARVVAGTAMNEDVALALGWASDHGQPGVWELPGSGHSRRGCPAFLSSLDAADLPWVPLRERGWSIKVWDQGRRGWCADAFPAWAGRDDDDTQIAIAPTEPQARIALALLCMAAEGER